MLSESNDHNSASEASQKGTLWRKLRSGLKKTRGQLSEGVGNLLLGEKVINDQVLEDLETALLVTDVGVDATQTIMRSLSARVSRRQLNNTRALHEALAEELKALLMPMSQPFVVSKDSAPFVVFFVGVNGVGKTTTIGKLGKYLTQQGHSVLLAAGDTFRAAAVAQLQSWGQRNDIAVVSQEQGADSASVVFDAVQAAKAREIDVVLADTAGRLQAKANLMEELRKIKRVVSRLDDRAPQEIILVIDAGVGQNALSQVEEFNQTVGLTGLIITKLDGSAKAGVLFAISQRFSLPVYFIGVGEGVDDLEPFVPETFVEALLASDDVPG